MAAREKREEIMIVNRRTGKALQSTGPDNGQIVEQATPNGSDAQLWTPVKAPGRAFKLVNKQNGKVLDVTHGSTEAGTWAQTWEDVADGESQVWKWEKVTSTYKKLINVQSGKVLDIVEMREDDGAPAQIWDDVEGIGQQWKLVSAEADSAPAAEQAPTEKEPAPKKAAARKPRAAKSAAKEEAPKAEAAEVKPAPKAPAKRGRKSTKAEK